MSDAGKGPLRAEVLHDLCVGVGMCTQYAPAAFKLNAVGQAVFQGVGDWTSEQLREAADACPMSAIALIAPPGDGPSS
jgi:ferredoxin